MEEFNEYFNRQIRLWGEETQKSLQDKKVAIIGSGGLGCTLGIALGASGIEDDFASIAGDTRCIEIKQGKFPCPDCVRLADELITRRLEEKDRSIG